MESVREAYRKCKGSLRECTGAIQKVYRSVRGATPTSPIVYGDSTVVYRWDTGSMVGYMWKLL